MPYYWIIVLCTSYNALLENFMLCQSYHDVCDVLVYEYIIDVCHMIVGISYQLSFIINTFLFILLIELTLVFMFLK
jgi:hypothetical protein